jgi:hypothetical protein
VDVKAAVGGRAVELEVAVGGNGVKVGVTVAVRVAVGALVCVRVGVGFAPVALTQLPVPESVNV